VKFTPEGGWICVGVSQRGGVAEVSVRDSGVGIKPEDRAFVFDSFYQGDAAGVGVSEGTGLGLAVTRALVEQHGGRIWFDSEPGKGTCFTFSLPLA
jgi:signal transduction histidine kinase